MGLAKRRARVVFIVQGYSQTKFPTNFLIDVDSKINTGFRIEFVGSSPFNSG